MYLNKAETLFSNLLMLDKSDEALYYSELGYIYTKLK